MARVVTTSAVTLPPAFPGQPAITIPKGSVIELTAAQAAAIASAGGSTRAVATTMHDTLGEAFGVSNST